MDHPPPYFFLVSLNRLSSSLVRSGLLGIFKRSVHRGYEERLHKGDTYLRLSLV